MRIKRGYSLFAGLMVLVLISVPSVYANKSSVSIDAPESVAPGSDITIKINVEHDGNSMFHYTKWIYVMINGAEIKRWDYSWRKRPEAENFTKEITYTVNEPIEIVVEASCNNHGSKGKAIQKVSVKK
jgi:desulfoferrodoxin (superoxide reductase-like protein)